MEGGMSLTINQTASSSPKNQIIRINQQNRNKGLLNPPPPPPRAMSFSYHPLSNHQPPLLPLPNASTIIHHHHQGFSSRKDRPTRDHHVSLTPKISKPTKREDHQAKKRSAATQSISEFLIVASSDNLWGPDPKDIPKNLPVVLTLPEKATAVGGGGTVLSPPPSSLPLPKFCSLRSKLVSCNAEAAAGVDARATNNLRRLLRL